MTDNVCTKESLDLIYRGQKGLVDLPVEFVLKLSRKSDLFVQGSCRPNLSGCRTPSQTNPGFEDLKGA